MGRERDAEAELNLPPGFRFHPTDEELVVHYLRRKVGCQHLPVPIIADVDLYKYDPWQLPEKALFGQKEWYFFTPRDRKYPNGSRPNRAAGTGYWKATGADKLIRPMGSSRHVGIKKALVFYAGKAPKGIKTNWIMHEYRLTDPSHPINKKGSLRLDDWVLCRLYNKKNNCKEVVPKIEAALTVETMDSFETVESRSPQSDVENDSTQLDDLGIDEGGHPSHNSGKEQEVRRDATGSFQTGESLKEDNTWFKDLNLDDLQNNLAAFGNMQMPDYYQHLAYQDYYFSSLLSPTPKHSQMNLLPF